MKSIGKTSVKGKKPSIARLIDDYLRESQPFKKDPKLNKKSVFGDLYEVRSMQTKVSSFDFLSRCVCNRIRHQWCLSNQAVKQAVNKLLDAGFPAKLKNYTDFEQLYDDLLDLIGTGKTGISYSTVYDCAIRLGFIDTPPIQPKDYVYVHRYLRESARRILGVKRLTAQYRIPRSAFDSREPAFTKLTALEIEDFLCVKYNDICNLPQP